MVSFEQAGEMLDRAVDALPEEIYRDLNGGVNLIPEERLSGDGRYIMGLYHNDSMGRYIEIFYGSFAALYGDMRPARFEKHLRETLHHELTHHLESKAGDRSLEKWDEEQTLLWQSQCTEAEVSSLLFFGEESVLPLAARLLFRREAEKACPELRSDWCFSGEAAAFPAEAREALAKLGLSADEVSAKAPGDELLSAYDAVLCMTLEQADSLAEAFPEHDQRIMCLGQTDIRPPRLKSGWGKTFKKLQSEIDALIAELCAEDK